MLPVALMVGYKFFGGGPSAQPQQQQPAARVPLGPYPLDVSMPPDLEEAVWRCWAQGTPQQCAEFAAQIQSQFPIGANALMARAWMLERASQARAPAPAPQVPAPAPAAPAPAQAAPQPSRAEQAKADADAAIAASVNGKSGPLPGEAPVRGAAPAPGGPRA